MTTFPAKTMTLPEAMQAVNENQGKEIEIHVDLYDAVKTSVRDTLTAAGKDPRDYDVDRIVASTPLMHGEIVQEFRLLRLDGYTVRGAILTLARRYSPMKEQTIRGILKQHRRHKEGA